jgi:hypothetical protein
MISHHIDKSSHQLPSEKDYLEGDMAILRSSDSFNSIFLYFFWYVLHD